MPENLSSGKRKPRAVKNTGSVEKLVIRNYNIRIPEPLLIAIGRKAESQRRSMHAFILVTLEKAVAETRA